MMVVKVRNIGTADRKGWICEHMPPQAPSKDNDLILCKACNEFVNKHVQVVDESGKPVRCGHGANEWWTGNTPKVVVHPNPNNHEETGYKNCWTCDHAAPQEPKEDDSLILCEACGALLDVPGTRVVDESGKAVQWGNSNPDGTLRAAGAGQ